MTQMRKTGALSAMRAARAGLVREKKLLIECHSIGATGRIADVKDRRGLAAIAKVEKVIENLDRAISWAERQA